MGTSSLAALATGPMCATLVGCGIWLIGIAYAVHFKRLLFVAASIIALATTTVRGLTDAGGHPPAWLADTVVYWGRPAAALFVLSFIAGRYPAYWLGRGWRL